MGLWGWWRDPRVRSLYWSVPGLLLTGLALSYFASSLATSVVPRTNAFSASVLFCWSLLFVGTSVAYLGGRQTLLCLWIGLVAFSLGGCALYLVSPSQTRFIEIMNLHTRIERYGGLGHPNTQGRFALICLVMLIGAVMEGRLRKIWLLPAAIFFLGIAWATMSRTPLIGGFAAIGFMVLANMNRTRALLLVIGVGLGIVFGVLALQFSSSVQSLTHRAVGKLTKTGDVEEVTTLTGRTDIWSIAFEHALDRPLFGNGPGATPILMEKKSGHAHNVLLDVATNLGFPAAFMVLGVFAWQILVALQFRNIIFRGTLAFLCINGLTERLLFGNIPESMTYVWLTLAFWGLRLVREEVALVRRIV